MAVKLDGYPFSDIALQGDIAQAYHQAVEEENVSRQSCLDAFIEADQEEQQARQRWLAGEDLQLM